MGEYLNRTWTVYIMYIGTKSPPTGTRPAPPKPTEGRDTILPGFEKSYHLATHDPRATHTLVDNDQIFKRLRFQLLQRYVTL